MRHAAVVAALAFAAGAYAAEPPIRTLLITGHNNHNWQFTSRMHADTLEATGRFDVTITDEPEKTLADGAVLRKYQLFVLDYNDSQAAKRWGTAAEQNFVAAVTAGTGVVSIHAADNAFKGWAEYEKMLGLMWRDGTGHGQFHPFDVEIVNKDHPITKGLSDFKMHPDELYHKLVNSQNAKYTLLARAMSAKDTGGTGEYEPMAFTLEFGKGHVFATPLGHVWNGSDDQKHSITDPQFKILLCRGAEWAATGKVTLPATWYDSSPMNVLSDEEEHDGWKLLFDGKTTKGWKGFKKDSFPAKGWSIKDGILTAAHGGGGGDICTAEQYGNFEFKCDWRVEEGGNSGIIYRASEDHSYPWETGPEFQLLDDAHHQDGKKAQTRAGTMYDVIPCAFDVSRPAGEWNHAHIIVKGTHVEHWLNGFKVVDIDTASQEYKDAVAKSKWKDSKDYGSKMKGVISLQDHGDEVEFRNIKVKKMD
jgi:type 1 glutamine amidotransferase